MSQIFNGNTFTKNMYLFISNSNLTGSPIFLFTQCGKETWPHEGSLGNVVYLCAQENRNAILVNI